MKIRVNIRHVLYISIALFILLIPVYWVMSGGFFLLPTSQPSPTPGIRVDPLFKEFYETLGGEELLGRPLTFLFERQGQRCQFTEAVLMCFNPSEVEISQRFYLAPLGEQLNVRDAAPLISAQAGSRDLGNGFVLYAEFSPLYDRLFGSLYAGRPLTQVRVDQANQRYEQFFENAGFYRRFDDPPEQVHLLPYGSYLCGPDCSLRLDEFWAIQQTGMIAQPFELSLQRLGWSALGAPLSQPARTADGFIEQVYDNALLFAPENDLSQVRLRPLVRMLDIVPPEPLVEKKQHDQLVFYEVKDGLGHNVPLFFDRFIALHGGRDLSGDPLTEMFVLQPDRVFRQCFENYCLDYDALAPQETRVRMVPLGLEYIRKMDPAQILRSAFSADTVQLSIEESHPQLNQGQSQRVTVHVYHRKDGKPMYLVEGTVTLTYPDRPSETLYFKPTDSSGSSSVDFQVPKDLTNMSVVEYRVCLNLPAGPRICSFESFLYRKQ